jgi:chaperone BCS1
MDVWIDFKHASQWQAEGIFKNFFPCKKSADEEQAAKEKDEAEALANPTKAKKPKRPSTHTCPILEEEELNVLAAKFAAQIPEDELSVRGDVFALERWA